MIAPLNGRLTHALSAHALRDLGKIAESPLPRQEVNPGVANRLERGELVRIVMLPSPYKTHKGRRLAHLEVTEAGRLELDKAAAPPRRQFPVHLKGALGFSQTMRRRNS